MIYGNIGATSWSLREIPPAGYSNAMNIARRDKRRTNDGRNAGGKETERWCKWERERGNHRESACKGYGERIPSSLLGMQDGQSALYTPHPSSRPLEGCIRHPRAWIVPCRIARPEYLKPVGIIQYGTLPPFVSPRVFGKHKRPAMSQHDDRHDLTLARKPRYNDRFCPKAVYNWP